MLVSGFKILAFRKSSDWTSGKNRRFWELTSVLNCYEQIEVSAQQGARVANSAIDADSYARMLEGKT